ncbi:hypothetical protein HDU98_010108 [Podochytrium sp. JEL0797]|nr:hypothetical protein HDU98_010108 [Podochytrium sp. JEL0797]
MRLVPLVLGLIMGLVASAAPVDTNTTTIEAGSSAATNLTLAAELVKAKADEADKSINHVSADQFTNNTTITAGGDWLLFFGSVKCPHCQKLTPQFLKFQQKKEKEYAAKNFKMAKVECTQLKDICTSAVPEIIFYPTLRIFKDGKFHQEFQGDDEIDLIETWVEKYLDSAHGAGAKAVQQAKAIAESGIHSKTGSGSEPNALGTSTPMNAKNIESLLAESAWFVKFYSPYCGHCKVFAPTWIEIATELKGVINVGEVDCTTDTALCNKFDVTMYPTIAHVSADKAEQFKGLRNKENVLAFAQQYMRPVFKAVSADEVSTILKNDTGLTMFYLYDSDTTPIATVERFAQVAASVSHVIEIKVCPEKSSLAYFPSLPATQKFPILLASQGESTHKDTRVFQAPLELNTDGTQLNLKNWIVKHSKPVLQKLDETSSKRIMNGKNVVVLGLVKGSDEVSKKRAIEVLRDAGKKWEGQATEVGTSVDDDVSLVAGDRDGIERDVVFVWMDALEKKEYVKKAFGLDVEASKFPAVLVVDTKDDMFYSVNADGSLLEFENAGNVLSHLENMLAGKLVGKPANGTGAYGAVYLMLRPVVLFLNKHPVVSGVSILFVVIGLLWYANARVPGANQQYAAVREPKFE